MGNSVKISIYIPKLSSNKLISLESCSVLFPWKGMQLEEIIILCGSKIMIPFDDDGEMVP
jgi:hypothetical protein